MAANSREKQILSEGFRTAIVSLTGVLGASDESWVPAISLSDFTQNDNRMGTLWGLRVDRIDYAASDPLSIVLAWNGDSPQMIAAASQSDELDYSVGGGKIPDRNRSGYDGNINLTTVGFVPGAVKTYSVLLTMVKLYR